jgi:hypothetical protein
MDLFDDLRVWRPLIYDLSETICFVFAWFFVRISGQTQLDCTIDKHALK